MNDSWTRSPGPSVSCLCLRGMFRLWQRSAGAGAGAGTWVRSGEGDGGGTSLPHRICNGKGRSPSPRVIRRRGEVRRRCALTRRSRGKPRIPCPAHSLGGAGSTQHEWGYFASPRAASCPISRGPRGKPFIIAASTDWRTLDPAAQTRRKRKLRRRQVEPEASHGIGARIPMSASERQQCANTHRPPSRRVADLTYLYHPPRSGWGTLPSRRIR
jgi:hypothetical protein